MGQFQPMIPPVVAQGASHPAIDVQGMLFIDIPCRRCGYNLRGLSAIGNCPECGTPVQFSLQRDQLRFSDPRWVGSLALGTSLMLAAVAVIILGVAASVILAASRNPELARPIGRIVAVLGTVLNVAGVWKVTSPDPSGIGDSRFGRVRKLTRFALGCGVWANVINLGRDSAPVEIYRALVIAAAIANLIGLIGFVTMLRYLGKLALRIPSDELVRRAHFLQWALPTTVILPIGASIMMRFSRAASNLAPCCLILPMLLFLLVFAVMYLFMLSKFNRILREESQIANQNFNNSGSPA